MKEQKLFYYECDLRECSNCITPQAELEELLGDGWTIAQISSVSLENQYIGACWVLLERTTD